MGCISLRLFHTGYAAIENVNSIDERRSKIVGNRVFDCHLSPDFSIAMCCPTGDKWQSKFSVKIECLIRFLCNRLQYEFNKCTWVTFFSERDGQSDCKV